MFKIGDFSKLSMVSVRMLRYYDETGLLKPAKTDPFTNYRYYSANQIKTLNLIVSLRDLGFGTSEISEALKLNLNQLRKLLEKKMIQTQAVLEEENIRLNRIISALADMEKEKINMSYNVTIKSIPEYKVISLRDIIPAYHYEGILWERLGEYVEKKGIKCKNKFFAQYHDECYRESDVDVEIMMEVESPVSSSNDFIYKKSEPLDEAVSILVPGDYINIAPAFYFAAGWIEDNGYEITGKSRQVTIKGPWNEDNPDNYLTEILIPVEKTGK